jgi:hypothetical protein
VLIPQVAHDDAFVCTRLRGELQPMSGVLFLVQITKHYRQVEPALVGRLATVASL